MQGCNRKNNTLNTTVVRYTTATLALGLTCLQAIVSVALGLKSDIQAQLGPFDIPHNLSYVAAY